MEIDSRTTGAKVEEPRRQAVQSGKEKILGSIPKVNGTHVQQHKKKYAPPQYKKGQLVYVVAYLKGQEGKFYVCQAEIEETPQPDQRRLYKVKIMAVGDRAIGGEPTPTQASLLGRTITKRENEITRDLAPFMAPPKWIILDPG